VSQYIQRLKAVHVELYSAKSLWAELGRGIWRNKLSIIPLLLCLSCGWVIYYYEDDWRSLLAFLCAIPLELIGLTCALKGTQKNLGERFGIQDAHQVSLYELRRTIFLRHADSMREFLLKNESHILSEESIEHQKKSIPNIVYFYAAVAANALALCFVGHITKDCYKKNPAGIASEVNAVCQNDVSTSLWLLIGFVFAAISVFTWALMDSKNKSTSFWPLLRSWYWTQRDNEMEFRS
jgi:hypothetical protein